MDGKPKIISNQAQSVEVFYQEQAKKVSGALQSFYDDKENGLRYQHQKEYFNASEAASTIAGRLRELDEITSPYAKRTKGVPDWVPEHKTMDAHFIANLKAAIVSQDDYLIELKPVQEDTKERVEVLNQVFLTEVLKARLNRFQTEAIQTSRKSLFGATLITWNNPEDLGPSDNISRSPISLTNIHPLNLYWDPNYTTISEVNYVYYLSRITWEELINDPILGVKKELLTYLFTEQAKDPTSITFTTLNNEDVGKTNVPPTDSQIDYNGGSFVLKTRFWLKNKNKKNQECFVSYFIGDNILLNTQTTGCSVIPISMVYEFKDPNTFYGASSVYYANPKLKALDVIDRKLSGQTSYAPGDLFFEVAA